jgi:nucleotide-binding universal stress UspA family protein
VDTSADSLRALGWAAQDAALPDAKLTVCHVLRYEPVHVPVPLGLLRELTARGEAVADQAAARIREANPELVVESRFERGHVAEILLQLSAAAEEVVLGDRGTGGFAGLPLGSVAAQLAAHASCTVTVVRGTADSAGAVVVGVEGFADDAGADDEPAARGCWR